MVIYTLTTYAETENGDTITLTVNQNTALVGGEAVTLDAVPTLIGGRAFAPVRFIAEALGATVS